LHFSRKHSFKKRSKPIQKEFEMDIRVPTGVLEHYKALPEDQLVIEVARLLNAPKGVQSKVEVEVREWLLRLGVYTLRPMTKDNDNNNQDAARWIAFAIRYLMPLAQHSNNLITGAETLRIIQERPKLVAALLFTTPEQCLEYLRRDYKAPVSEEFMDVDRIINSIQYSASSERTIYKRAEGMVERLQTQVIKSFLDASAGRMQLPVETGLAIGSQPKNLSYLTLLEWYAERVPSLSILARRDAELFKAQLAFGNQLSSRIPWIGLFTTLTIMTLSLTAPSGNVLVIGAMVGMIVIMLVYILGVIVYFSYIYSSVRALIRFCESSARFEKFNDE
jgi:hypothetical protein